ncbi:hypothetical protein ACFU98_44940 [Streptomyces sp. NPDC057575]|uniref:hypothetical protein n=1 Tax=unclassified Streptomyces TaxID=2593676 RepID=UPI0036C5F102
MSVQLGRRVASFRGTFTQGSHFQYAGFLALALGLSSLTGLTETLFPDRTGTVADGLYALGAGTVCLAPFVLRWLQEVVVYEHGVVRRRLTGTRTVMKSRIAHVQSTRKTSIWGGTYDRIDVTLNKGTALRITGIKDPLHLMSFLAAPENTAGPGQAQGGWQPPAPGN